MENMEPIQLNSELSESKEEEKSKLKNSFHLLSNKNNDFLITFDLEEKSLSVSACDNKLIKNFYKENFSLQYLK